jgi:adenylate cyclase
MRRAVLIDPGNNIMRYNLACACAVSLKDVDSALNLIQPYLGTANAGQLHHVASDPDLDPLRDHPRFKEMLAEARARVAAA